MMQEVRPIDANALKKDLSEFNYDMALRIVDAYPTIEPEVRHGRWECGGFCSECGLDNEERKTDYCPNCGAKMDGGAEQ